MSLIINRTTFPFNSNWQTGKNNCLPLPLETLRFDKESVLPVWERSIKCHNTTPKQWFHWQDIYGRFYEMEGTCFVALLIYTLLPRWDAAAWWRSEHAMFSETWRQWILFLQTCDDIPQQTVRQLNTQRDRHSSKQAVSTWAVFNRLCLSSFYIPIPLSSLPAPPL